VLALVSVLDDPADATDGAEVATPGAVGLVVDLCVEALTLEDWEAAAAFAVTVEDAGVTVCFAADDFELVDVLLLFKFFGEVLLVDEFFDEDCALDLLLAFPWLFVSFFSSAFEAFVEVVVLLPTSSSAGIENMGISAYSSSCSPSSIALLKSKLSKNGARNSDASTKSFSIPSSLISDFEMLIESLDFLSPFLSPFLLLLEGAVGIGKVSSFFDFFPFAEDFVAASFSDFASFFFEENELVCFFESDLLLLAFVASLFLDASFFAFSSCFR
jgi:hypothetical protein